MNKTLRYSIVLFIVITIIVFCFNLLFSLIGRTYEFSPLGRLMMLLFSALASGLCISWLIIITTPVIKNYLATFRQLLRLDTLSHPLLLKMQKEAPATFQHSLQVANLANKAAKAIGADAFLTRIGGYYHDIGKLSNPNFFIENKRPEDINEEQDDHTQVAINIKKHIHEGIKLGQEYKLPHEVISFIPQHHGTLSLTHLYNKAKQSNTSVLKKDFRYPGPKPMSKEAAILMLADAVESILRTYPDLSDKTIDEVIHSTIESRLEEKQLELCGLSKNDLQKIKVAFSEAAHSLYHQRIKYDRR